MNTTVINSDKGKKNVNSSATKGKAENEKVNGMPVSAAFEDKAKTPADNAVEPKPHNESGQAQVNTEAGKANAEPTKAEIRAKLAEEKPAINLEETLKKIKVLGRLSGHRDKLIETTDTLDAFEIQQIDEVEEPNLNPYQGCVLVIKDDKGREFSTKNPFIIGQTAKQIKTLCYDKLGEVEAQISATL